MGTYKFQAKTPEGKTISGEVEAANETEARVRLRAQKLTPLRVGGDAGAGRSGGSIMSQFSDSVSAKDLQVFTRQFYVLVNSGVPIVQSLQSLVQASKSRGLQNALSRITERVESGRRLADAMAMEPKIFDRLYINLVRAGEEAGALDTVLSRLADYIEKSVKLKGKLKAAMFYPAAIVVVAIGVISAIMIFVIPKLSQMFKESGQELPKLTQMVIGMSDWCQHYWFVIIGLVVGVPTVLKMYHDTEDGRKVLDALFLGVPLFGTLIQKGAIARFSRTLATLLTSGVSIIEALEISSTTSGNYVLEKSFYEAKDFVAKGKNLAEPLRAIKAIPKMVTQMVAIGEDTGNLDQMLNKVADFYEEEVENTTSAMTSMIEPILMVVLGGVIAVIVVAMYLPIFNLAGSVGG
jgi:type IV pilus assembly protein PilC